MKKIISTIFILIALLAMTTGAAFAGSALELVEVRNDDGGPTFIFRVTGEFSRQELESGYVYSDGEYYPLYCNVIDAETVLCHTTAKVGGTDVRIGFGGATFWDRVPDRVFDLRQPQQFCYPVYDWNYTEPWNPDSLPQVESQESGPSSYWVLQGANCQDSEAQFGDYIYEFYSPTWDDYYDYQYLPGDFCGWVDPGAAYYYPYCPEIIID